MRLKPISFCRTLLLGTALLFSSPAFAQQDAPPQRITKFEHDRATAMLQMISNDIRKHYYDPKFHGVDWDARVAEAKVNRQLADHECGSLDIAGALIALNDSHTFFLPPARPYKHDYGFQMQMVGITAMCFACVRKATPKLRG